MTHMWTCYFDGERGSFEEHTLAEERLEKRF